MNINIQEIIQFIAPFIWQGMLALAVLTIGWALTTKLTNILERRLEGKVNDTLLPFISTLLSSVLKIALVVSVLSTIGVETTSLAALIGALGLAAGMAMSGSLQNLASAVILLFFKPFTVGEFISCGSSIGTVTEITPFNTVLQKPDKVYIYIPNSELTSNEITNYSRNDIRRMEYNVGVSYKDNLKLAKEIILNSFAELDFVLQDPEIKVGATELGDSSVNIKIYYWIKASDYLLATLNVTEKIKENLDKAGIEMPFPQRDVHMVK